MNHTIWTEKYRPSKFSEIKGQKEIVNRVEAFVQQKNMPHLLFAGPAGIGKTTLSLVVAKQMFGESWRSSFLELNASDERGIDVIRTKVKDFARTKAIGGVPFKIIYLDECDALTKEAQQALRRTMENYTQTTRFILSCNYSSKIIDPIQSRCVVFRFKLLKKEEIFSLIDMIANEEGLKITERGKEALYEICEGDCRRMENILQSCSAIDKDITEELAYSLASVARPKEIKEILDLAVQNKFIDARKKLLDTMLNYGLSGIDVIKQIYKEILSLDIDNRSKMQIISDCGEVEFRMTEGSDEYLQLECLLSKVCLAGSKKE
ncbi:MAG: replication factor C small subunit [Nanoarchaeota archaeon]|nr:replication factor C small subunit [Nanoarchaeota archaeon]